MENNKYLITVTVLLSIVVLLLGGYIVFDKVYNNKEVIDNCEPINDNDKNEIQNNAEGDNVVDNSDSNLNDSKLYSLDGKYEVVASTYKGEKGDNGFVSETFYFNSNGLFHLNNSTFSQTGYYGNYIVENNQIKLNYLFNLGGGYPNLGDAAENNLPNAVLTIVDENTIKFEDGTTYKKEGTSKNIKTELFDNYNELLKNSRNS